MSTAPSFAQPSPPASVSSNLLRALSRGPDGQAPSPQLSTDDRDLLTDLGAAVVTRWSTIPRDVQRQIFEAAAAIEATPTNAESVRNHLAVFLHQHKDHNEKDRT